MRIIWSLIVLLIIAATSIQPVNSYAEAFTVKAETPSIAPGRFIAVYIGDDSNRREPEIASRIVDAENLVEVLGGRVVKRFFLINGFAFEGDYKAMKALEALGFKVYPDRIFTLQVTPFTWDSKPRLGENVELRTSVPTIGANILHSQGITGEGVIVAVVDTGIQNDHPQLRRADGTSVVIAEYDATGTGVTDYCGKGSDLVYFGGFHGTAVAGVIASQSQNLRGVAPDASIYDVIVFSPSLGCSGALESDIISGIEWAVLGPDGIPGTGDEADVINLSLGALAAPWALEKWYEGVEAPPILLALRKAVENGIIVTISAGNFGGGWGLHNINYLCAVEGVLCVGASDDNDTQYPIDDVVALFSSRGPLGLSKPSPHIVAPGVNVETLIPTETGFTSYPLSGTSFSAPHVAGAAALLLSLGMEPDTVRLLLAEATTPIKGGLIEGVSVVEQGSGLLRVDYAAGSFIVAWGPGGRPYVEAYVGAGSRASVPLSVRNLSNIGLTIEASIRDGVKSVYLDSYSTPPVVTLTPSIVSLLDAGATAQINVEIDASNADPGVYEGVIELRASSTTLRVPLMIVVAGVVDASLGLVRASLELQPPTGWPGWSGGAFRVIGVPNPLTAGLIASSEAPIYTTILSPAGDAYQGYMFLMSSDGFYKVFLTPIASELALDTGGSVNLEISGPLTVDLTEVLARIDSLEADLNAVKARISNLEDELVLLNADLSELGSKLASLESSVEELDGRVSALEGTIASLEAGLENALEAINVLQVDVEEIKEDLVSLNSKLGDLENSITTLETRVSELKARLDAAETRLSLLEDRVTGLEEATSALEAQVGSLKNDLSVLSEDLENLKATLDDALNAINDLRSELETARSEIKSLQASLDATSRELKNEINIIKTNVNALEAVVNELLVRVSSLESKALTPDDLDPILDSISSLEEGLSRLEVRLSNIMNTVSMVTERIETFEKAVKVLEERTSTSESSIVGLEERVNVIESKLSDLEKKVSSVEREVDILRDKEAMRGGLNAEKIAAGVALSASMAALIASIAALVLARRGFSSA